MLERDSINLFRGVSLLSLKDGEKLQEKLRDDDIKLWTIRNDIFMVLRIGTGGGHL